MFSMIGRYALLTLGTLVLTLASVADASGKPQPYEKAIAIINEEARLADASLPPAAQSGTSVSISNGTAVVGAPLENNGRGAAYVYVLDNTNTWVFQQKLTATDPLVADGDRFGASVSVGGDVGGNHVAVGAAGRDGNRGAVYTFVRSGGVWTQNASLTASDVAASDQFGSAVSIQGLTLVAGSPFDDVNSKTDVGSAYVFENNGSTWVEKFHIQVTTGQAKPGDHLGWSVSLHGNTVLVGAPDDDFGNKTDAGSVYVYVRNGARWTRQARINPGAVAGDRTGSAVALFSNTALFGADGATVGVNDNQGKVLVYRRSGTLWSLGGTLTASDGAASDRFGASVALSGPLAVIGAPQAAAPGANAGKSYVFGDPGAGFAELNTLIATTNAAGDLFGTNVALDSGRALVGAPLADATGANSGAAYVFSLLAASTTTITTIDPPTSVTGQSYDVSVSVTAPSGTPAGTVDVSDSDGSTCTITLVAGSGTCTLTSTAAFLHTISASYSGSLVFGASQDTDTHLVNKANTTVAIDPNMSDPTQVGESVIVPIAVGVVLPGAGNPTGTVAITGPATAGCTVDLAVGQTCTLTFTAAGPTTLVATYSGDADFNGSDNTASPEPHTVLQAQTITVLNSTPNPSLAGRSVTLTATIGVTAPGAGPPAGSVLTGSVSFFDGTSLIGSSTVGAGGVASTTTSFSTAGTHQLRAVYVGDANYAGSTSPDHAHVVNTNLAPTANPQSVTTPEDVPVPITLTGSDPEGATLTFTVTTGPINGILSGTAPNLTYTPNANFSGADSFAFTVSDELNTSAAATVSITVTNVDNDAPTANPQSVLTPEDVPVPITLTGSDPEGTALTFAIVSGPANGTLTGAAPNLVYAPNLDFSGTDSFTFTVSDGVNTSIAATVTITVVPAGGTNTPPTAANDAYTTAVNVTLTVTAPGVLGNDTDPDVGTTLTAVLVTGPSGGTLSLAANGSFTYTPATGFLGTVTFTYRANDGTASSAPATVTITVGTDAMFKDSFENPPPPAAASAKVIPLAGAGSGIDTLDLGRYTDALDAEAWAAVALANATGEIVAAFELRRAANVEVRLALVDAKGWRHGAWATAACDAVIALRWLSLDGARVDRLAVEGAEGGVALTASW